MLFFVVLFRYLFVLQITSQRFLINYGNDFLLALERITPTTLRKLLDCLPISNVTRKQKYNCKEAIRKITALGPKRQMF